MTLTIGHVLSTFGAGGQEQVALDLAAAQLARGLRVVAVSLGPAEHATIENDFAQLGIRVVTLKKRNGADWRLVLHLARLFRREAVSVVHTHNPQPLIYGAPAAKMTGIAVVHTKHGVNPPQGNSLPVRRAAGFLTDAFIAVSAHTARAARKFGDCPGGNVEVIVNGIDTARFASSQIARTRVRRELGIPANTTLCVAVGRLTAAKNHALLIDALTPLLCEKIQLVIAGCGELESQLRATVAGLHERKYIHLLGARKDIPDLLAAGDIFTMSSLREGLPLVILEAMATGLPVVSTSVGGIPDVVKHGVTGVLVDSGNAQSLREAVVQLARDPVQRADMGMRGQELVTGTYSRERMAERYLAVYRRVA